MVTWLPFALAGMCGVLLVFLALAGRSRPGADQAARHMRAAGDAPTRKNAARTAKRLGVDSPGLTIGHSVSGGAELLVGWEDGLVMVSGPRAGKTRSVAIPALMQAPGAVIATSNKRDLLDATRSARAARGPVVVFDPQGLAGEPARVFWNPLSYVTDELRAAELADVFAAAEGRRDREDAFFAPKGRRLAAALLLAAASSGRAVDVCHRWVTDPRDDEPIALLRDAGYQLVADALRAEHDAPEKQRAGIFASGERVLGFLSNQRLLEWCTPGHGREPLDAGRLVDDAATLYLLSREGRGNAGALVAGLTVAAVTAAEERAAAAPGGRLPVPLVCVLDEAANVCRWPELPNFYSHAGGRGIVLLTFAQAWSQLVGAFGEDGAKAMWSAARLKLVSAGVADATFLGDVSALIGDADEQLTTTGRSRHGRSTTTTTRRRRILDAAAIAALPRGRAVLLAAGSSPQLVRLSPWEGR